MPKLSELLANAANDINTITRRDLQSILRNCADIAVRLEAKESEVSDVRQSVDRLKSDWRHAVFNRETEKSFSEWQREAVEEEIDNLVTAITVGTDCGFTESTRRKWAAAMHHYGYRVVRVESADE